jgi:hypothetical protein
VVEVRGIDPQVLIVASVVCKKQRELPTQYPELDADTRDAISDAHNKYLSG